MNLLSPMDASTVYRDLHKVPTVVGAFGPAHVSLDPSRDPPNKRCTRSLADFVAYKAAYGLVRGEPDARSLFEEFARWSAAVHWSDPADPRALPFHVFEAGADSFDLAHADDADRFLRAFGKPSLRQDGAGRTWRAGVAHGRGELQVAGLKLPAGAHWDVSSSSKSWRIMNSSEIWRVDGRGYVNAAPNEHIRGPQAKCTGQARRVWHAGTKNAPHRKKKGH